MTDETREKVAAALRQAAVHISREHGVMVDEVVAVMKDITTMEKCNNVKRFLSTELWRKGGAALPQCKNVRM